jgi:hypothetical protein
MVRFAPSGVVPNPGAMLLAGVFGKRLPNGRKIVGKRMLDRAVFAEWHFVR